MIVSLISIVLIMKEINAQEQYVLGATDVCFDSRAYTIGYEFSPPYDGEIIGIKLEHKSGVVDCNFNVYPNSADWTYWGCAGSSWIFIEMILMDTIGITYYPTATTDGISGLVPLGCSPDEASWGCSVQYYYLSGYDGRNSPYIELRDSANLKQVSTYNRFSIQYGEGCCDVARPDNSGTACADVYFIYTNIYTDDPTRHPTANPSQTPTADTSTPTRPPTKNPTQSPSVYPTPPPSTVPTAFPSLPPTEPPTITTPDPSVSPSDVPVASPTLYPTDNPTRTPSAPPSKGPDKEAPVEEDTTDAPEGDSEGDSLETDQDGFAGMITSQPMMVGVVGGSLCVLICVAVAAVYLHKKKKKKAQEEAMFGIDSEDVTDVYGSDAPVPAAEVHANSHDIGNTHAQNVSLQNSVNVDELNAQPQSISAMQPQSISAMQPQSISAMQPMTTPMTSLVLGVEMREQRIAKGDDREEAGSDLNHDSWGHDNKKGPTAAPCTDCGLVKAGKIYEDDQLFYCIDCFSSYDHEAN